MTLRSALILTLFALALCYLTQTVSRVVREATTPLHILNQEKWGGTQEK